RENPRSIFDRQVIDVEEQSASRAVVTARIWNISPVPPEVAMSEADHHRRDEGDIYRYIFDQDQDGWKLVQIEYRLYPGATGWVERFDAVPFRPIMTDP